MTGNVGYGLLVCMQVYNVSSGKSLPQWLSEAKKASLKKNEDYRRRLELLQDFEFPAACQRIKITPDQQYIFASGYHPPQVSVPLIKVPQLHHVGDIRQ